ncbi:MAG: hypothetical protein QOK40_3683 [Miltoncostaeaceae bacterium]|nr:hypothetical protein [Miltoncostaeaceae bacterium]
MTQRQGTPPGQARAERATARLLASERAARAAAEAELEQVRAILLQIPAAVLLVRGPHHQIALANDPAVELFGRRELVGLPIRAAVPELTRQGFFELLDRAYGTGEPFVGLEVAARIDRDGGGRRREAHFNFVLHPLRDAEGRVEGVCALGIEITEQVRARQRAESMSAALERQRARLTLLAESGPQLLSAALHESETLDRLAALAVSDLADLCLVDILEPDGSLRRTISAHAERGSAERAQALESFAPRAGSSDPVIAAIETGSPQLLPEVPDALIAEIAQDGEHLRLMRELGFRSAMVLPLAARGRTLGAISLISGRPGRYGADELALAEALADGAALALDNARVYREARAAEQALRESHGLLRAVTEGTTDAVFVKDRGGRYLSINSAGAQLLGRSVEDVIGRDDAELYSPETAAALIARDLELMERGEVRTFEEVGEAAGVRRTYLTTKGPYRDPDGNVIGLIGIARDISARKDAERRAALLAELSSELDVEMSVDQRLTRLANRAVPALADYCVVRMLEPDGTLRTVETVHRDPRQGERVAELRRRSSTPDGAPPWVLRVVRDGRPELVDLDGLALESAPEDPALPAVMRALKPRSVICTPLRARGRTLGAISFMTSESERRFGPEDLPLVEELGRRAGLAVANARLYQAERRARRDAERAGERVARLQDVTAALSRAVSPEEVAGVVVEQGIVALGAVAGLVALRGERSCTVLRTVGYPPDVLERYRRFPLDAPIPLADAIRTGEPVWLESRAAWAARYAPRISDHGASVALPLTARGRLIGGVAFSFADDERPFGEEERAFIATLGEQCAQALERARLYQSESAARATAERAAGRLARLQRLTAALSRALTPSEVADVGLADVLAAAGASAGGLLMPSPDGERLEPIRAAGATGEAAALLGAESLMAATPSVDALARAEPVLLGSRGDMRRAYPELAARADRAVGAVAALPLLVEGQPTGVLCLTFRESRRFGDEDRALLATLARLCAQALGRATRYEAQHRLAEALQRSLLPTALPEVANIEIAVRYLPAEGLEVGGDWYEAVALPGGHIGVAVGDVVGRGAAAAAAMGQLRSALRAYALEGESPARALDRLSRFAEGVEGGRVATVAYVVIDPASGDATYGLAGHPPPLVISAEGEAAFLEEARSGPLAALPDMVYADAACHIPSGATLLLYSDGAVERRGAAIDDGLELLATHAAAAAAAGLGPEALCSRLLERLFADRPAGDDVALLAVRRAHRPPQPLRLRRPARADELPRLRAELREWLRRAGAGDQALHDVLLSCGEAVANVLEHAYAGTRRGEVVVELEQDPAGGVVVTVRDDGRWRAPRTDLGTRRRGFLLMRRLMDSVQVDRGEDGTTVVMRRGTGRAGRPASSPAPAPEAAPATARGPARAGVTVEAQAGHGVARVTGEIDRSNAARVAGHLREAIPAEDGGVVVDLSGVAYLDSAGALALVELGELLRDRGQRLLLAVPQGAPVRRLLEISGVDRIAAVTTSVAAALAAAEG